MRRIAASFLLLPMLLLLLAAPAAAAPPLRESGTQEFLSAFSSTCGPTRCTDTIVDAFTVAAVSWSSAPALPAMNSTSQSAS